MREVKLAVAQYESKIGDCEYNLNRAKKVIKEAAKNGAKLVVFPELYYQSYYNTIERFHELAETCDGYLYEELKKEAIENEVHIIMGYCEKKNDQPGKVFNTLMFLNSKGERIANYTKVFGWDTEKDIFTDGLKFEVADTELGKIGLLLCYDIEFPEAHRILSFKGAELIVCCAVWRTFLQHRWNAGLFAGATQNLINVCGVNTTGFNLAGQEICGDSKTIHPSGKVIDVASKGEEIFYSIIDMDETQAERDRYPIWKDYHYDMFDKELLKKY